jgi:hypothetical protein
MPIKHISTIFQPSLFVRIPFVSSSSASFRYCGLKCLNVSINRVDHKNGGKSNDIKRQSFCGLSIP